MADDGDKIRSPIKKSTSNSEISTLNDGLSHLYTSRNSRLRPKKIGDNANLLDMENSFESNIEVTTTSLKRKKQIKTKNARDYEAWKQGTFTPSHR